MDIALVIDTLKPIYVFFGALEAWPSSCIPGIEIFKGKLTKKIIHQIKMNNTKLVNKYIYILIIWDLISGFFDI